MKIAHRRPAVRKVVPPRGQGANKPKASGYRRPGPPPGILAETPLFPDWIFKLVKLRDVQGRTFEACAEALESNRQNVWKQYKRWNAWAWTQPEMAKYLAQRK